MNNIIQLVNGIAIVVDDLQFKIARRKFFSLFHWSRFLVVIDTRGHKITIRKKDVILFEESCGEEKK